eukprot:3264013-Amphidinium_carterae.1
MVTQQGALQDAAETVAQAEAAEGEAVAVEMLPMDACMSDRLESYEVDPVAGFEPSALAALNAKRQKLAFEWLQTIPLGR